MKKLRSKVILFAAVAALLISAVLNVSAANGVKPKKISRVGKASRSVTVGEEFELKVKVNPGYADDDYLRWKIISGKKIITFDDYDTNDDEADFRALKAGTAKARCYIKGKESSTKIDFTITVKKADAAKQKITRVGSKTQYAEAYDDIELEVKKSGGVAESKLEWSIGNTKILRFESKKHTGHEMEFETLKPGTTTVTCKIKGTDKKVTFTVKVLAYYDD